MTNGSSGSAQGQNILASRRVFEGEGGKWSRSRRWRRKPRTVCHKSVRQEEDVHGGQKGWKRTSLYSLKLNLLVQTVASRGGERGEI